MIVEHACVTVRPGHGPEFEAAVAQAVRTVLAHAQGFLSLDLYRCIEEADSYICAITWASLEDHMVTFREGPLFAEWRALVGPHFAGAPTVRHYDLVEAR